MPAVLVVDDDQDNVRIIQTVLSRNGYEARVARNGEEALRELESGVPDLILLDIMMPELSGIEVLERIRSSPKSARTPVILLTAKAQDEDVISGYQYGADYYITKPFTPRQLLYGMRLVLGEETGT